MYEIYSLGGHFFREHTNDRISFTKVIENKKYLLNKIQFSEDDIVVDIGANIGAFCLWAINSGAKTVYAYEANSDNHKLLLKNINSCNESKIIAEQKIVFRSDKETHLKEPEIYASNAGIANVFQSINYKQIENIGLDDIIRLATNNFKKRIKLLKISAEFSEYPILYKRRNPANSSKHRTRNSSLFFISLIIMQDD